MELMDLMDGMDRIKKTRTTPLRFHPGPFR